MKHEEKLLIGAFVTIGVLLIIRYVRGFGYGWTETKTAPGRPGGRVYSNIPDNDMLHVKQVPGRPMPGMNQSELNAAIRNLMGNENNAFK